jgi:mannose/fructose/N-acetylgalactosamine-specific phosphotransferase system component IIB
MNLIVRIDDRLIHGQVTAGWVRPLGIEKIIVANDKIVQDSFQKEIYTLAVPPGVEVQILSVEDAVFAVKDSNTNKKTIVLVNSTHDALRLIQGGVNIKTINVGGLHYEPGKYQMTSYIFLSDEDIKNILAIIEKGVILEGQEIPGSPKMNLNSLILTRLKKN